MKAVFISVLFCTLLVAIPLLLFNFGDWVLIALQTGVAAFLGLLIGIEIERETYRYPHLWQGIAGLMAGALFGFCLTPSLVFVLCGGLLGSVLGVTAHWWVKFAPLP